MGASPQRRSVWAGVSGRWGPRGFGERFRKSASALRRIAVRCAPISQTDSPSGTNPEPAATVQTPSQPGYWTLSSEVKRSEEHTSELQSHLNLVCRLLLEKKKKNNHI